MLQLLMCLCLIKLISCENVGLALVTVDIVHAFQCNWLIVIVNNLELSHP